jgi:hypothetical protein
MPGRNRQCWDDMNLRPAIARVIQIKAAASASWQAVRKLEGSQIGGQH